MLKVVLILIFIFKVSLSFSHSQLTEILPKNNVVYNKVPSQINMKFKSSVKLVKIDMFRVENKEKIAIIKLKHEIEKSSFINGFKTLMKKKWTFKKFNMVYMKNTILISYTINHILN